MSEKPITDLIKKAYKIYFDCALGDQEKNWAPHISCLMCATTLNRMDEREPQCDVFRSSNCIGLSQKSILVTAVFVSTIMLGIQIELNIQLSILMHLQH